MEAVAGRPGDRSPKSAGEGARMDAMDLSTHPPLRPSPATGGSASRASLRQLALPASVGLIIAARAALASRTEPHNDEAYYWAWSHHLDWSFFDHPPTVAVALALARKVLGSSSPLALHLPALAFGAMTSLLLAWLARDLFPSRPQLPWSTALAFNLVPLFSMGSTFTTPDAPLAFFWALALALFRLALRGSLWAWCATGAAVGLGFLSKYNMALLPPSLFLFLATSRHRTWLLRKEPYLALGIALLFLFPIAIWNARHGWASVAFHLIERHRSFRPAATLLRFAVSQLAISPLLLGVFAWGGLRSFRRGRKGDDAHWFLFCAAAPTLLFFAAASVRTFTLPNWTAMGYLPLVITGMLALEESAARAWSAAALGTAGAMAALLHLQAAFWLMPLPLALEPCGEQRFWKELMPRWREQWRAMPPSSFAFTSRFQSAALLSYYAPDVAPVTRLSGRRDQYDLWRDDAALRGRDALYLADERSTVDPKDLPFEHCEPAGQPASFQGGLRRFALWRCKAYRP